MNRARRRALLAVVGACASLVACSLARPLDYLQEDLDKPLEEGGSETSTTEGGPPTDAPSGTKTPTVLAEAQELPRLLRVDADNLYWTTGETTSTLVTIPKAGGSPRTLLTLPPGQKIQSFTVEAAADGAIYVASGAVVSKVTKTGIGAPVPVLTAPSPIADVLLDKGGTTLFLGWGDGNAGVLARVPKGGGTAVVMDSAQPEAPYGLADDDANVFYASDTIYKQTKTAALPEGGVEVKGTPLADPDGDEELYPQKGIGIRLDGLPTASVLFWTQTSTTSSLGVLEGVFRNPAAPGSKPLELDATPANGLAVDDKHAYYTAPADGSVRRVLRTGGDNEVLLSQQAKPTEIALDASNAFVLLEGKSLKSGAIVKFAK